MIERIIYLLKLKDISANKMSQDCGFSSGTFSKWKAGEQKPSADAIVKIAKYFNVSTDYLLTGAEDMMISQNIIGNENHDNSITISGQARALSEIELELIKVCAKLDVRKKTEVLTFAYKILENFNKD